MAGDCFPVAGRLIWEVADAVLCHGLVTGTGAIKGLVHWHAWVEQARPDGAWVIDRANGNDIEMPADIYYRLARVDPAEVHRYAFREACTQMLTAEHWGPWVNDPTKEQP